MTVNSEILSDINHSLSLHKNSKLLIVTKNQNSEDIDALLKDGYRLFGENRVQEASLKYNENLRIKFPDIDLHLIGPLQSNKTRMALMLFDSIQTLDRKKIIDEIAKEKKKLQNIRTKKFFIQVNIGIENQKSGINPSEVDSLYDYAKQSQINIIGLMCIPPNNENSIKYFSMMNEIKNKINSKLLLSMGMSSDYLKALEKGSNIIRVGSKIFN